MALLRRYSLKYKVLSTFGLESILPSTSYIERATRILVDSLAYIVDSLNLKPNIDSLSHILSRLGIEVGEDALKDIIHDILMRRDKVTRDILKMYQYEVPRLLSPEGRKKLAAYYTGDLGTRIMGYAAKWFVEHIKLNEIILADPFMGTAVTLTQAVEMIGGHRVKRVWGVEKHPLACIVAYAALLGALGGDPGGKVYVRCGDAFEIIWGRRASLSKSMGESFEFVSDVVLTNPPFTRWELLEDDYRDYLVKLARAAGFSKYIVRKQVSLQALSLFLVDTILGERGLVASVLPASTFYTIYGEGVKRLLRDRYRIISLIQAPGIIFSSECGFKEVILIAINEKTTKSRAAFITLEGDEVEIDSLINNVARMSLLPQELSCKVSFVDLYSLPQILDSNWLLLFEKDRIGRIILDVITDCFSRGVLAMWKNVLGDGSMVRGVEMYGPNFFLIPNDFWKIVERRGDMIVIRNVHNGRELEIGFEYLVPSLRKPGLYRDRLVISPDHYLISIPPLDLNSLSKDVREYIAWGVESRAAYPAIRVFGKYWYAHVYRQLRTKSPYGYLFLPDKVDARFRDRGVFASISPGKYTATKNFYIFTGDTPQASLLSLWFNSSLFLLLFIYGSRKISETWTRFLVNDYLNLPIPNIHSKTVINYIHEAEELIKKFGDTPLPPLKQQLHGRLRYEIDSLIAKTLKIPNSEKLIEELHKQLSEAL